MARSPKDVAIGVEARRQYGRLRAASAHRSVAVGLRAARSGQAVGHPALGGRRGPTARDRSRTDDSQDRGRGPWWRLALLSQFDFARACECCPRFRHDHGRDQQEDQHAHKCADSAEERAHPDTHQWDNQKQQPEHPLAVAPRTAFSNHGRSIGSEASPAK